MRGGVWAAQPAFGLLTSCGSITPKGLKAKTIGGKGSGAAYGGGVRAGELVSPSDYPADEALSEMVDTYEALLCWFYLPAGTGTGD